MPGDKFNLRALQPSDGPALDKLIVDFDGEMVTSFLVDTYSALIFGVENATLGVGVECAGVDGLIGVGTVRFTQAQFNGEILPLAFLDGLKVHKDFRGQGLGLRIAQWRIQQAREAFGERCVIATGMLRSNAASHAVAAKWCREFIDSAFRPLFLPIHTRRPPASMGGMSARELAPGEFAEFALKQNAYYRDQNFFAPDDAHSIAHAAGLVVEEQRPYRFFAVVDSRGSLLAGAKIWLRGLLKSDRFVHLPLPLRMLNRVAPLLPRDLVIRDASVITFWCQSGGTKIARYLWECLHWELKDLATTIVVSLDPRDPSRRLIPRAPVLMPRIDISLAVRGPVPVDREKLIFGVGRL